MNIDDAFTLYKISFYGPIKAWPLFIYTSEGHIKEQPTKQESKKKAFKPFWFREPRRVLASLFSY